MPVTVRCLGYGHTYISEDSRHVRRDASLTSKGIIGDCVAIPSNECVKCDRRAIRFVPDFDSFEEG